MAGSWEAMASEERKIWGLLDLGVSLKSNFTRGFLCIAFVWQQIQIMKQIITPHLCVY